MKKNFIIFIMILCIPFVVRANKIGEFNKTISVSLNSDLCVSTDVKDIKLQLYADGKEVDGLQIVLNSSNNFHGSFQNLPIFLSDGITEIEYEVKYYEDGVYRSFNKSEINYKKENFTGWISVTPDNIKPGKDYVLLTDNWFYQYNNRDPLILIDGDLYHQYVDVNTNYIKIGDKTSYYSLVDEPNLPETLWHFEKLSEEDSLYDIYKGYWVLTNYNDLNLVLSGYMGNGYNSYYYKVSNNNGLVGSKSYANRILIEPITDELSRFRISSQIYWSEDHLTKLYLGIGSAVEVKAQREEDYGAHIIAFEYVYNTTVEEIYNVNISKSICRSLKDSRRILITNSLDVLGVFEEVDDFSDVDFSISDSSILKIENGKIVPLKIGETDISFTYGYTDYVLHVEVYDLPNDNPYTSAKSIIILVVVLIVSVFSFLVLYKKINLNS